ncbi:MAG TPA: hypothetical protein VMT85_11350 [Thermoanaerobaculia bacterium]|nr:hypothetical protein [Thermoanaerobaculia bacterium]
MFDEASWGIAVEPPGESSAELDAAASVQSPTALVAEPAGRKLAGRRRAGLARSRVMRPRSALPALAILMLSVPGSVEAQLLAIDTPSLELVYPGEAFSYLVRHAAACSENALRFHRELYDYEPDERITILLEDFSDYGHGGANTVPNDFVNFGVAPFSYVYGAVPAIDRFYWMANHEMAHIVTMDQAAGRDLTFRRLLGGKVDPIADAPLSIFYNYLTNPRWNAPRWYHEGIAVFLESWMAGGLGRVLGGYDEMVFRSMVRDDAVFYDVVGLESEGTTIDFQVGVNSYLYGTRFMSYLAHRHGPEKLVEWTARRPGSRAHFASQFEHVFGRPLPSAWSEWIEAEKEWQRANLEAIHTHPVTPVQPVSEGRFGSVSRAFVDPAGERLYVAVRYPGQLAHITALDLESGQLEKLVDVDGAALFYVTSLAFDPDGRRLFYTTDNYGWRDLNVLELETGRARRLQKDLRVGDLAFDRSGGTLWGVRHFNGISTIVRIEPPYESWDHVHSFPYGRDLYDLDVSPDGRLLAGVLAMVDGSQHLVVFEREELLSGAAEHRLLFDFEKSSPSNFTFSDDGRFLIGTSYYSGVSNVFRYDLAGDDLSAMSNVETGLFRPTVISEDELLAFLYTGRGLVPVRLPNREVDRVSAVRFLGTAIAERHPVVRDWRAPSPRTVEVPSAEERVPYRAAARIAFESAYPIVEGYKSRPAAGYRFNFSDSLNLAGLDVTASYSTDEDLDDAERLHLDVGFHYWAWEVRASYNRADFYDLFGPFERSRRGYSLGFSWQKTLIFDEPRKLTLSTGLTGYGDLETLPDFQNVGVAEDELLSAEIALDYEYLWKSLGAVDIEKGTTWRLVASSNTVDSGTTPRLSIEAARGFPLPIDHSSIWLRGAAGSGFGDRNDPFAGFFFGGFRNNFVDRLDEKRFRTLYAFPGRDIDELGGRSFARAMLEWTLPPVRFRRLGVPSFYVNWLRPALFAGVLQTDPDASAFRTTDYSAGLQLDLRIVFFSNLSTTLSLGWAQAWGDSGDAEDEWMISLKIL